MCVILELHLVFGTFCSIEAMFLRVLGKTMSLLRTVYFITGSLAFACRNGGHLSSRKYLHRSFVKAATVGGSCLADLEPIGCTLLLPASFGLRGV